MYNIFFNFIFYDSGTHKHSATHTHTSNCLRPGIGLVVVVVVVVDILQNNNKLSIYVLLLFFISMAILSLFFSPY